MRQEPKWLLPEVVVEFHVLLIEAHGGGSTSIRDFGALESACMRARQFYHYSPSDASLERLAALYAVGIAKNHPFVDGNKRTALTAMGVFLDINGVNFTASEAQAAAAMEMAARGTLDEDGFTRFVADHMSSA